MSHSRMLCLDVSSSVTGWALLRCPDGDLAAGCCGRIVPKSTATALTRIDAMVAGVVDLLRCHFASRVVMEWSAGKVYGGSAKHRSGLAVLGQAQGAVYQAIKTFRGGAPPETVLDIAWTARTRKETRAKRLAEHDPVYAAWAAAEGDGGADAADAVGLGRWLLAEERAAALLARGRSLGLDALRVKQRR